VKGGCPHTPSPEIVRRVGLAISRVEKAARACRRASYPRARSNRHSNPQSRFDDSTEGASGRRCAFSLRGGRVIRRSSIVRWSWLQVCEHLRARRPHRAMTRGVEHLSRPPPGSRLRDGRVERQVTAGELACPHGRVTSRSLAQIRCVLTPEGSAGSSEDEGSGSRSSHVVVDDRSGRAPTGP
jgi:hypothetical protein